MLLLLTANSSLAAPAEVRAHPALVASDVDVAVLLLEVVLALLAAMLSWKLAEMVCSLASVSCSQQICMVVRRQEAAVRCFQPCVTWRSEQALTGQQGAACLQSKHTAAPPHAIVALCRYHNAA